MNYNAFTTALLSFSLIIHNHSGRWNESRATDNDSALNHRSFRGTVIHLSARFSLSSYFAVL